MYIGSCFFGCVYSSGNRSRLVRLQLRKSPTGRYTHAQYKTEKMADLFCHYEIRKTKPMLKIYNNCSDDNPTNKLPKLGGLRPPRPPLRVF